MKKKKADKIIFWQDWGIFPLSTMVVVGYENMDEVIKYLKKVDKNGDWLEAVSSKQDFDPFYEGNSFSLWSIEKPNKKPRKYTALILREWNKKTVESYKILAHELVHGISFIMPDFLDPMKENEAFAYMHSYLFEEIAYKLNQELT